MKKLFCLLLVFLLLPVFPAFSEETLLRSYQRDTKKWTHVLFGRTPTTADETEEPISWRILSVSRDSMLLLSDKILFTARVDEQKNVYDGWEQSELYDYLNDEFLKRTFSWAERCLLVRQMDRALVSLPEAEDLKNPQYGFTDNESRWASGTEYAVDNGLQVYNTRLKDSPYWTRTISDNHEKTHRRVIREGNWGYLGVWHTGQGVRPMIQVSLKGVSVQSGDGTIQSPCVLSLPEPTEPEPVDQTAEELQEQKQKAAFLSQKTKYADLFPVLTEEGFLPEGKPTFSLSDPEKGLWLYVHQDLRIEIVRRTDLSKKSEPKLWFEADLFVRPGSEEVLRTFFFGQDRDSRERTEPELIARENKLAFAINTDYYLYRVLRNARKKVMTVGVVLRGGEVLYDDPARKDVRIIPNRDLLAIYPDGRMEVYAYNGATAKELKRKGAWDVLCFGPVLLLGGQPTEQMARIDKRLGNEPRSGIGMVEPGHYVAIVMQGRSAESKGCKLSYFTDLFQKKGCAIAFNLDGGGTASMIFMGETLNVNAYEEHNRLQNELLGIGVMP